MLLDNLPLLNDVRCAGDTLLVDLPVQTYVPDTVTQASLGITIIGQLSASAVSSTIHSFFTLCVVVFFCPLTVTPCSRLGLLLCVLMAGFTLLYRHRTMIKSASPWFLAVMLLGFAMLFIGAHMLVQTDPTDAECAVGFWFGGVGFFLGFA